MSSIFFTYSELQQKFFIRCWGPCLARLGKMPLAILKSQLQMCFNELMKLTQNVKSVMEFIKCIYYVRNLFLQN